MYYARLPAGDKICAAWETGKSAPKSSDQTKELTIQLQKDLTMLDIPQGHGSSS